MSKEKVFMKNKQTNVLKKRSLLAIIALVAVIGFSMTVMSLTGCKDPVDPTVTWPQNLTAMPGQKLSDIPLSSYTNGGGTAGAFSWTKPSDSVGDVGTRSHSMTFTPSDTKNYNTVTNNVAVIVIGQYISTIEIELVSVPGGKFTMGSSDSDDYGANPPHQVTLSAFYMGKYEVTQGQWQAVMGSLPSSLSDDTYGKGDNNPIYYVSWYDALVFCNKLSIADGLTPAYRINNSTDPSAWGTVPTSSNSTWNAVTIVSGSTGYRLPTEAQWEYACRAGTTTAWHSGETDANLGDYAWFETNSGSKTHEVGKKQANAFGLYDMSGNVWEWCWDWYGDYTAEAKTNPTGASSGAGRVERGGSWVFTAQGARSAYRYFITPNNRYGTLGFRLLRP